MYGVNGGSSSLANWNRGYENVSLPGAASHPPAPTHPPQPPPAPLVTPLPMHPPQAPYTPLVAPLPMHPPVAWDGSFPAPAPLSRPPTVPPGSPPAEARGGMIYQTLDGFFHPGPPPTPGRVTPALPNPPAPALLPPSPAPAEDNWLRPQSPTYLSLKNGADFEKTIGFTLGTSIPAGIKEMTPEQAAATTLFKRNLEAFDPSGFLRGIGEFGQAFRPEGGGMTANTDIHYMLGGAMFMPPGSYRPETSQVIHSHPVEPSHINNYPSDADYYAAYFGSKGNGGNLKGETMYHPESGKFYYYEPKLNAFGSPEFHELVNPYDMGQPTGTFETHRPLPDVESWGSHFIKWPEEGGLPPAAP